MVRWSFGETMSYALWFFWLMFLLIEIVITIVVFPLNFSVVILILFYIILNYYLTSKIMDFFDMHGWFQP